MESLSEPLTEATVLINAETTLSSSANLSAISLRVFSASGAELIRDAILLSV
jgi:hypothetical protein